MKERLFARAMEVWRDDPDGLAQRIRESQRERFLLRDLAGTGKNRLF